MADVLYADHGLQPVLAGGRSARELRAEEVIMHAHARPRALSEAADKAADTSCQSVLAMLAESPDSTHAITSDTKSEADAVIVTLAIRGQAKLHMAKDRYDPFTLLELLY